MNSHRMLLFIIVLIGCFTMVSSDIYAPSLPAISQDLGAHINNVQWSMAIFMLGVSISQLFYGPISEGVGRRVPLLVGFTISLLGGGICLLAPTISWLILGRFVQGVGAGAGASLWRTIFRDSFTGDLATKYVSYMVVAVTFIVPAAPALGGYLQEFFGWRSTFAFLILYALFAIVVVLALLQETSKHHHKERLKPKFVISSFRELLSSPIFMGYAFCVFLSYGAFFCWYTIGPVLLIEVVGMTPMAFGWITFLSVGSAMALSGYINGKMVGRVGSHFMLRMGWSLMMLAGLMMLILNMLFGLNVVVLVAPMVLFYFGVTFIWPSAFTGAFAPFGKLAGYAGALYSCMQIGGGAVIGSLVAYLPDTNQIPLACVYIIAPAMALVIFQKVVIPAEAKAGKTS